MFDSCCAALSRNRASNIEEWAVSSPQAPASPPSLKIAQQGATPNSYPIAGESGLACYCGNLCGKEKQDNIVETLRRSWSSSSRQKDVASTTLDMGDEIFLSPVTDDQIVSGSREGDPLPSLSLVIEDLQGDVVTSEMPIQADRTPVQSERTPEAVFTPELASHETNDEEEKDFMKIGSTLSMISHFSSAMLDGPYTKESPADTVNNSVSDPEAIRKIMANDICIFGTTQKDKSAVIEPEFQEKHLDLPADTTSERMKEMLAKIGVGITSRKARKPDMPNQDNLMFFRTSDFTLFGIADGHGTGGHWVSHWVARFALHLVLTEVSELGLKCLKDTQSMNRVYNLAHEALLKRADQERFDVALSGTTLCICAIDHTTHEIYSSCVGDSGCVLSRASKESPEFLTVSHKPDDIEERRRIVERGGEVSPDCRVCLRGQEIPGLAMSRSIGDEIAHKAGVIHQPSLNYIRLDSLEKASRKNIFICCSDGVWDFMEPEEAVRIVNDFGPLRVAEATTALVQEARDRWLKEKDGELTDDISAIVLWL